MEQVKPLKGGNKAVINTEECKLDCLKCKDACRLKAITQGEDGFPVIDVDECFGCGDCEKVCPSEAITIFWVEGTDTSPPHRGKFLVF
ncbi:MAG: 4Fe-4S dicluster domain-containing protein [Patescibacteria group bacterium]